MGKSTIHGHWIAEIQNDPDSPCFPRQQLLKWCHVMSHHVTRLPLNMFKGRPWKLWKAAKALSLELSLSGDGISYGKIWQVATQHSTAKEAKNTKISQFDPICWACDMQHDIMQHLTATQLWCQSLGWDTLESLTIHSSDSNVRTWLILINRDNMILQYILHVYARCFKCLRRKALAPCPSPLSALDNVRSKIQLNRSSDEYQLTALWSLSPCWLRHP